MSDDTDTEELPATAGSFADAQPDVWDAYSDLGRACSQAGPLDDETRRLVKLALAIGAESEGATHSHVRRGLDEGLIRTVVAMYRSEPTPGSAFAGNNLQRSVSLPNSSTTSLCCRFRRLDSRRRWPPEAGFRT